MNTSIRLVFVLMACIAGVSAAEPTKKPSRLADTAAFSPVYRDAVRAVARSVDSPQDFFAEIESQKGGRELWFHLWHKTAFLPENLNAIGNHGGKCRDVVYDTKKRKVTKTWWWQ